MRIYTKTGDQGKTKLVGGTSVDKFDLRLEAYGTVDELNSFLGLAKIEIKELDPQIHNIQNELFNIGSLLACEKSELLSQLPKIKNESITRLETEIDHFSSQLDELKNFILPGGHKSSALLHICRTVCRRAERKTAQLQSEFSSYDLELIYLNRLSDWLFVAARFANKKTGHADVLWSKI